MSSARALSTGFKKKALGGMGEIHMPEPMILVPMNRYYAGKAWAKPGDCFAEQPFILPEASYSADGPGMEVAVVMGPTPSTPILSFTVDASKHIKPTLSAQYRFLIRQNVHQAPRQESVAFMREHLSIGFTDAGRNKLWSRSFLPFGMYPFILNDLLVNRTPAFRGLPFWCLVAPKSLAESAKLSDNEVTNLAHREVWFPNGSVAAELTQIVPLLDPYLCFYGIPVSRALLEHRYPEEGDEGLLDGKERAEWYDHIYGDKQGKLPLLYKAPSETTQGTAFIPLDSYRKKPTKELKVPKDKEDTWRFFAIPSFDMGTDQTPAFEPLQPKLGAKSPMRITITLPEEGDKLIKAALTRYYTQCRPKAPDPKKLDPKKHQDPEVVKRLTEGDATVFKDTPEVWLHPQPATPSVPTVGADDTKKTSYPHPTPRHPLFPMFALPDVYVAHHLGLGSDTGSAKRGRKA